MEGWSGSPTLSRREQDPHVWNKRPNQIHTGRVHLLHITEWWMLCTRNSHWSPCVPWCIWIYWLQSWCMGRQMNDQHKGEVWQRKMLLQRYQAHDAGSKWGTMSIRANGKPWIKITYIIMNEFEDVLQTVSEPLKNLWIFSQIHHLIRPSMENIHLPCSCLSLLWQIVRVNIRGCSFTLRTENQTDTARMIITNWLIAHI